MCKQNRSHCVEERTHILSYKHNTLTHFSFSSSFGVCVSLTRILFLFVSLWTVHGLSDRNSYTRDVSMVTHLSFLLLSHGDNQYINFHSFIHSHLKRNIWMWYYYNDMKKDKKRHMTHVVCVCECIRKWGKWWKIRVDKWKGSVLVGAKASLALNTFWCLIK